ncbi:unnamed protein product, partial [Polarella glacialis]
AELEADQKAKEATVQPEVVLGPPSPKPSKGGLKRTRIYSGDSGEVSQVGSQSQSVASSPAGKRVGMRASLAAAAEAAEREAREKEEELARDDAADAALAKQTLPGSIVKAETLMNQLLEPEVVHLFAMFLGTFELLFANYSDVPTRAGKGHMTIFAFTRFCFDFGLFPTMIDLKSLQQIYGLIAKRGTEEIAIAAVATAMAEMAEMAESRNGDEGNAALDRGGTASSAGGLSRPRLLSQSKSSPSGGLRRSGRYLSSQLAISEETVVDPDGPDGLIFWNGIQIPRRLSWISKESADLSEAEGNCFAVLSAINDWLKDRSVKIHEFFLFLDTDGSGKISVEEMQAGLTFMRFFGPPSPEEVAEFFPLIASPETGEIAIWELQQSLVIISKQKTKLKLARAGFMKLDSQMSSAELKASIFFKDLAVVMQRNKWTPEEMFQQFDLDGSGDVGQDELTSRAKKLLANSCGRCPGLDILSPFELLDTNGDGVVSQSEFCGLMLDLRKAQLMMDEQGLRNKLKLVTANAVLDSERRAALLAEDKARLHSRLTSGGSTRRASNASTAAKPQQKAEAVTPFGLLEFGESLQLVAFEVLGSRGSVLQAEQPTVTKATWLLLYLRWKFESSRDKFEEKRKRCRGAGLLDVEDIGQQCVYVSPLERIAREAPDLFADVPGSRCLVKCQLETDSEFGGSEDAVTKEAVAQPCASCKAAPRFGWGCLSCPKCSEVDAALEVHLDCIKDAIKGPQRVAVLAGKPRLLHSVIQMFSATYRTNVEAEVSTMELPSSTPKESRRIPRATPAPLHQG